MLKPLVPKVLVALLLIEKLPSDALILESLKYIEPVPVLNVPLTQRLEAMVEVPSVLFTSMAPAKVDVAVVFAVKYEETV